MDEEQVLVNDIPVELSGVTRLNCQALLCEFPLQEVYSTNTFSTLVAENVLVIVYSLSQDVSFAWSPFYLEEERGRDGHIYYLFISSTYT